MNFTGGPEWKTYKPKSVLSDTRKEPKNKTTTKAIETIKSTSKLLPFSSQIQKELVSSSIEILYDIHKKGLFKGRGTEKVSITILYINCRIQNLPVTLDEISKASGVSKKEILRLQKIYSKLLNLQLPQHNLSILLRRFSSDLRLERRTFERCEDILNTAIKHNFSDGLSPNTIIGTIIYLASKLEKDRRSQSTIAKVMGVSELTIRNGYQRLNEIISQ